MELLVAVAYILWVWNDAGLAFNTSACPGASSGSLRIEQSVSMPTETLEGIRETLASYVKALETCDAELLEKVKPAKTSERPRMWGRWTVALDIRNIQVSGSTAIVTGYRSSTFIPNGYIIGTDESDRAESGITAIVMEKTTEGRWVIDRVVVASNYFRPPPGKS